MELPWTRTKSRRVLLDIVKNSSAKSIQRLDSEMVSACKPMLSVGAVTDCFKTYFEDEKNSFSRDIVFGEIIPCINRLIIEAPDIMQDVVVAPLPAARTESHSYTRLQIAVMIAHMWYNAYAEYDYLPEDVDANDFCMPSFINIFTKRQNFALACVMRYFYYVCSRMDSQEWCEKRVIYRRYHHVRPAPPSPVAVNAAIGCTSDFDDLASRVHVVSANETVCGWCFAKTLTQEEAVMLVRPELLLLMLIAPKPGQASLNCVIGAEKITSYVGIGSSLTCNGSAQEELSYAAVVDGSMVAQIAHVFVPAANCTAVETQYIRTFRHDISQLFVAFSALPVHADDSVSIGTFTYGLNGCPHRLRVIQVAIAASLAGVSAVYCTVDPEVQTALTEFAEWSRERTVDDVIEAYDRQINARWNQDGIRMETDVVEMLVKAQGRRRTRRGNRSG